MCVSFLFTLTQKGLYKTFRDIKRRYENIFLPNFAFMSGIKLKKLNHSIKEINSIFGNCKETALLNPSIETALTMVSRYISPKC